MGVRLVIGRAGTGKTVLCAREIRAEMARDPLGGALLWITPQQATFTAERLLLTGEGGSGVRGGEGGVNGGGTFRAQVLSFRRLAMLIGREVGLFTANGNGEPPKAMDEMARLVLLEEMVRRHRGELTVFGAVADRPGFLKKLDAILRELRQQGHSGASLRAIIDSGSTGGESRLDAVMARKLLDLALLLDAWSLVIEQSEMWDFEQVMHQAALQADKSTLIVGNKAEGSGGEREGARVWVDSFSVLTALEIRMLVALGLHAREVTITLLADPDAAAMREMRGSAKGRVTLFGNEPPAEPGADGGGDEGNGLFTRTERLQRRLMEAFGRHRVPVERTVMLRDRRRFVDGAIARVEAELFDDGGSRKPEVGSRKNPPPKTRNAQLTTAGVELWECSDPETEVRVVAQAIREMVIGNGLEKNLKTQDSRLKAQMRYRQIGVIVPDLEGYQDAVRRIFAEHGIPHFVDQRRGIAHHPLVELLRSAAAIVSSDWETDEVLLYLKTQLAGVSEEDVALVENYVLEHGITRGAWSQRWTWVAANQREEDADGVTHGARERLERVNEVREKVWNDLRGFVEQCGGSAVGAGANEDSLKAGLRAREGAIFARALRGLLQGLGVEGRIGAWMEAARGQRDMELAQVHEQAWREMNQLLGLLEGILAGKERTLAEFERLLGTALENLTLGLIPPTVDQVLISSVARSRVPEMEVVFVLGAVEGQFPKVPEEDPILSDAQREIFNACATEPIGEGSDRQLLEMPFLDYVALTRARRLLVVSYPLADRRGRAVGKSRYIARLRELLGDQVASRSFDAASRMDLERIGTVDDLLAGVAAWARGLIDGMATLTEPPAEPGADGAGRREEMAALYDWVMGNAEGGIVRARELVWRGVVGKGGLALSPALAQGFFPAEIPLRMSVSQLEKLGACPLQYFLHYTLGLRPREEFALDQLELGNLYHRVLEEVYRKIIRHEMEWPIVDAGILQAAVESEVETAVAELHAELAQRTPGYDKVRARTKRTLGIMVEADRRRACVGRLRPAAVELVFGRGAEVIEEGRGDEGRLVGLPVLRIATPGEHTVLINGKIDRLDAFSTKDAPESERAAAVIDYKSGKKRNVDLGRMLSGLGLQLPVYALVMRELARLSPAAAFYVGLGMPRKKVKRGEGSEPGSDKFFQKLNPRGFVDGSQVQLLDGALGADGGGGGSKSEWYNVKFTNKGDTYKTSDVLGHMDFQLVLEYARWRIGAMADNLMEGHIAPAPYREGKDSPCMRCDFVSLCPFDRVEGAYRELHKMPNDEALAEMRKGTKS